MNIRTRRWLMDRFGRGLATLGALTIFTAIFLLVGFIAGEICPLFKPATVGHSRHIPLEAEGDYEPASIVASGIDEYLERAFLLRNDGSLQIIDVETGQEVYGTQLMPEGREIQRRATTPEWAGWSWDSRTVGWCRSVSTSPSRMSKTGASWRTQLRWAKAFRSTPKAALSSTSIGWRREAAWSSRE